ncbi:MAG: glycosyltransferase [Desulfuromonadaceae bacterium]|nr:glycosyltransferase [Desulfuromonadaceae bacterium]
MVSTQPLVSVIVSSYNHEQYIEECLLSIINQTYPNIELIVTDDGSKDDTAKVIESLQKKYDFNFHTQKNQGLVKTLNDCIARAKGEFIAPFGSDDVMLPERIAIQVEYFKGKPEVGICAGNIEHIDPKGNPLVKRNKIRPFKRLEFEDIFCGKNVRAPAPTLLIRKDVLLSVGGYDPQVELEDLLMLLKTTREGYFVDVLGETLAKYRIHESNTYKNRKIMIEYVLKTYKQFEDHPCYPEACAKYLNSMFVKCSKEDKILARKLIKQIPFRYWTSRTIKGFARLVF